MNTFHYFSPKLRTHGIPMFKSCIKNKSRYFRIVKLTWSGLNSVPWSLPSASLMDTRGEVWLDGEGSTREGGRLRRPARWGRDQDVGGWGVGWGRVCPRVVATLSSNTRYEYAYISKHSVLGTSTPFIRELAEMALTTWFNAGLRRDASHSWLWGLGHHLISKRLLTSKARHDQNFKAE